MMRASWYRWGMLHFAGAALFLLAFVLTENAKVGKLLGVAAVIGVVCMFMDLGSDP